MKTFVTYSLLLASLVTSSWARAQEESDKEADPTEAAAPVETDKVDEKAEAKGADYEAILNNWVKTSGESSHALPRRWLFLQEQGGAYGAPTPLAVDRGLFESYGWFRLADPEAIRLFVQMNPSQKKDVLKPEELPARLKRYMDLSQADAVILKNAATPSAWALYVPSKGLEAPQFIFDNGPESLRQDLPARWLAQKLGYDAVVVAIVDDNLILAKLRPLKRGAQGLILKKSATLLVGDAGKDIGALLRVMHEGEDYVVAKVSLSKSGRPKVPVGSKVLFDQP